METKIALNIIAIVLAEPSNALLSNAFAVPIACEADPSPIPRLIGFFILNRLKIYELNIAPEIPATITKTAANGAIPSNEELISIATGVVTDFGAIE